MAQPTALCPETQRRSGLLLSFSARCCTSLVHVENHHVHRVRRHGERCQEACRLAGRGGGLLFPRASGETSMALALLFAPAVGRLAEHRHRADGPADAHRNGDAAPGVPSRRAWVDAARSALRLPVGCVAHAARLQCIPRGRLLRLSCAADAAAARARTQGGERSVRSRPRAARRPRLPRPHDAPLAAHARPGTVRDTSETHVLPVPTTRTYARHHLSSPRLRHARVAYPRPLPDVSRHTALQVLRSAGLLPRLRLSAGWRTGDTKLATLEGDERLLGAVL